MKFEAKWLKPEKKIIFNKVTQPQKGKHGEQLEHQPNHRSFGLAFGMC